MAVGRATAGVAAGHRCGTAMAAERMRLTSIRIGFSGRGSRDPQASLAASGLPPLLAALPEHQSRFRAVSRNPSLLADGHAGSADGLPIETLRNRLAGPRTALSRATRGARRSLRRREVTRPRLRRVTRGLGGGREWPGSDAPPVDADRRIPGRLDRASGAIEIADLRKADIDDLLDDLAEAVLGTGGEVVVVPAERMPTSTGLAAIYRY